MGVSLVSWAQLPNAPSEVKQQRKMKDFWISWSYYGTGLIADGIVSNQWAGKGIKPCGYEKNRNFARLDGSFKTKKYFIVNGTISGSMFVTGLLVRKWTPAKISNHWLTRLFIDSYPLTEGTIHFYNTGNWMYHCM